MKNIYRAIYLAVLLLVLAFHLSAQMTALKIGDQVPDLNFPAFNYNNGKPAGFKFSDLKGKLIILDFWGTFCEPCLEGFSKLDSMQKYFKDRIQIITVNPQKKR